MNIFVKLWNNRHMLRYIHKTVYFNFRSLPFRQAIKLPIWLYRPNILSCKGKIELGGGVKLSLVWLCWDSMLYPFILRMAL